MPGRKRGAPRAYRRSQKRRRSGRRPIRRSRPRRALPLAGFPNQKVVKLRWVYESDVDVSATSGLSNTIIYNANDMYNPLHGVTQGIVSQGPGGSNNIVHQPKGFDQWMAVYCHWTVLGSKIKAQLVDCQGSKSFVWGVARTAAATTLHAKSIPYILEFRNVGGKAIMPSNHADLRFHSRSSVKVAKYSAKKEHGKNITNNENLRGSESDGPCNRVDGEGTFYSLWMAPSQTQTPTYDGQTPPATTHCKFLITIDYIALLTEPRALLQS